MKCARCNTPLAEYARFCPRCGAPVSSPHSTPVEQNEALSTTKPAEQETHLSPSSVMPPTVPMAVQPSTLPSSNPPAPAIQYSQPQQLGPPTRPAVINTLPANRARRRRGCLPAFLISLVVLVALIAAGWVFVVRPYVHDLVVSQLDQAMTNEVNLIPVFPPLPAGPVRITDATLNNLITLNLPSSIPIQHAQAHISPGGIDLTFQINGLPCSITGVPVASGGHLLLSHVTINGVISIFLSAQDVTALANRHFDEALVRVHHSVRQVSLKDQEMDLLLE
jgi:hypothetical protein